LRKFKERHHGQDCFIIGNGPSLNKIDLQKPQDYYTFGLNKIYLLFDKTDLDISYLVAVNKLVIEQSKEIYKHLRIPMFISFKNSHNVLKENENINYIYNGGDFTFKKDISQKISDGATVTFVAMQIAYYMGFQNVFLVGIDHNFKASGKPNEKQFINGDDENHFDPNYFGRQEWQLPNLEASELAYRIARYFYNRDGRMIYDATVNGKLTVYPKITYEEALHRCKKKK
jgi:hypothetical protein